MSNAFLIYLILCLIVSFIGRRTRLGWMRTLVLAFMLTPLVAFIYLLLFASLQAEDRLGGR
ncbi:hypothetical protein [Delftia acidovorans]|uniref:hypothetical protein n=1 Tax=Delftia acidovorans TaxID=80866 RepID=UPI00192B100E|nr:hypothetical protein [Delftia acidovorans]